MVWELKLVFFLIRAPSPICLNGKNGFWEKPDLSKCISKTWLRVVEVSKVSLWEFTLWFARGNETVSRYIQQHKS